MKKNNNFTIKFFKYIYNQIGIHFFSLILLNIIVGLLDGLGIALFIPLLTLVGSDGENSFESLGQLRHFIDILQNAGITLNLINILIIMVIMFSAKGLIIYLKNIYNLSIRLKIIKQLRFNLIDKLKNISFNSYTQYDAGKVQNILTVQVERTIYAMTNFFQTLQSVILVITYITLAFLSNWEFAILVTIGGLSLNFIYKQINKATKNAARNLTLVGNVFNKHLIQVLQNFKYLKSTNYINKYSEKFKETILETQTLEYKIGKLNSISEAIREPLTIIIIATVIIIQVQLLESPFAGILVSLLFFYRALTYLVSGQGFWNYYLSNSAGYEAVSDIIQEFEEDSEPMQYDKILDQITQIEVSNIILSYGDKTILKNISMSISEKQSIALVGESGAGKTTLANVICGLAKSNEGELMINNQKLKDNYLNSYRNKIGYISQDPVIFNDTVFNNITFWDEKNEKNLKRFWHCIELVALDKFINELSKKENTELGNNGILVSGGQKQRISIARELYKDVDLLIMDEATSALDSETEKYIKESIDSLQGKYMMVIIAHRLSTIKNVDRIYLMENGSIIAQGNYNQLYSQSQRFKKMVDIQNLDH